MLTFVVKVSDKFRVAPSLYVLCESSPYPMLFVAGWYTTARLEQ